MSALAGTTLDSIVALLFSATLPAPVIDSVPPVGLSVPSTATPEVEVVLTVAFPVNVPELYT